MKWTVAQDYRDDNPAGDAISAALPKTGTVRKHQRALPFAEVGAELDEMRASGAFTSTVLAIEFLVLTACRSSEVRLATWDEMVLRLDTWAVPASRMEGAARPSGAVVSARAANPARGAGPIQGVGLGLPLGAWPRAQRHHDLQAAPGARDRCRAARVPVVLPRLGGRVLRRAPRGLRAHVNSDGVEAHYRRTDLFKLRRVLMEEWSGFVGRSPTP